MLDPARTDITQWSTPTLLTNALAVVTTPSTIALDAAMAAAPVAVIRYGQDIPYYAYYEPLPLLDNARDWHDFLEAVQTKRAQLKKTSQSFLKRVSLPGNAAEHILNVVGGGKTIRS